jgi:acyl-ACP thioesterase
MIYREAYSLRWHDTDATREVRPAALLAYMQETANHQFKSAGSTLDAIRDERGVAFILSRIGIEITEPLHAYEDIEVETFTCPPRAYTFPRGFRVLREGREVARAMSQWALVRVADRSLVRARDAADMMLFGDEAELSLTRPLRICVPQDASFAEVGTRRIGYADIDYNLHMNNTKYPDMLCDFLPDPLGLRVVGMTLSYCREAAYGATLTVLRADGGNGTYYFRALCDEQLCLEAMLETEQR